MYGPSSVHWSTPWSPPAGTARWSLIAPGMAAKAVLKSYNQRIWSGLARMHNELLFVCSSRASPLWKTPSHRRQRPDGVYIHEALGHPCEADLVAAGVPAGKLGEKIGNEIVTVVDDPTMMGYGAYPVDDEGVNTRERCSSRTVS